MNTKFSTRHWVYIALAFFWLVYEIQNEGLNLASLVNWLVGSVVALVVIELNVYIFRILFADISIFKFIYRKFFSQSSKPKTIPAASVPITEDKLPSKRFDIDRFMKIGFVILSVLVVVVVAAAGIYWYRAEVLKKNLGRLVELGIARERVFWQCFDDRVKEEERAWHESDEHKQAQSEYDKCLAAGGRSGGYVPIGVPVWARELNSSFSPKQCGQLEPQKPQDTLNEHASSFCSKVADQSEDGRLMAEFRNKVPQEALTDNELRHRIIMLRLAN